jgi:hypothetical protein
MDNLWETLTPYNTNEIGEWKMGNKQNEDKMSNHNAKS